MLLAPCRATASDSERQRATGHWHPKSGAAENFDGQSWPRNTRCMRITALPRRFSQSPCASTAQSFSSLRLVERRPATDHWHPKSAAADNLGGEFGLPCAGYYPPRPISYFWSLTATAYEPRNWLRVCSTLHVLPWHAKKGLGHLSACGRTMCASRCMVGRHRQGARAAADLGACRSIPTRS